MSDCIALAKLVLASSRRHFTVAFAYWLFIHAMAALFHFSIGAEIARAPTVIFGSLIYATVPLLFSAFALFTVNQSSEYGLITTGYSAWVMRTPVATWKLAAVPLAMRTLWVFALCGSLAISAWLVGFPMQRWFLPAIGFSTLLTSICWFSWRPFRWRYSGLAIICVLFFPAYGWFAMSGAMMFSPMTDDNFPELFSDPRDLVALIWLVGIAGYALAFYLSIRAVRLARSNVLGLPSESAAWFSSKAIARPTAFKTRRPPRVKAFAALLSFDFRHFSGMSGKLCLAAWCALVLLWSVPNGTMLGNIIVSAFLFMIVAMFMNSLFASDPKHSLPRLIATAPISSSKIVWTRQLTLSVIWIASIFGGVLAIVGIHWIRGTRFYGLPAWNASMNSAYGLDDAGLRIAGVIVLIAFLFVVRHSTSAGALLATGRPRYQLYSTVAKLLIGFVIFSWLTFEFMQFPDWESWLAWTLQKMKFIPYLLPYAVLIKLACVVFATRAIAGSKLVNDTTIPVIFAAFFAAVFLVAVIAWQWIPDPHVLLWHCMATAFVLVPLSRILIAPVCLQSHRTSLRT